MKECDILGGSKHTLIPRISQDSNPQDRRPCVRVPGSTLDARLKRLLRMSPTCRNVGRRIQQVLMAQLPDMPWHLHSCRIWLNTCCNHTATRPLY